LTAKQITQFFALNGSKFCEKSIVTALLYLLALTIDPKIALTRDKKTLVDKDWAVIKVYV